MFKKNLLRSRINILFHTIYRKAKAACGYVSTYLVFRVFPFLLLKTCQKIHFGDKYFLCTEVSPLFFITVDNVIQADKIKLLLSPCCCRLAKNEDRLAYSLKKVWGFNIKQVIIECSVMAKIQVLRLVSRKWPLN